MNTKYRPDIDGLRGLAVLAVVIYHFFPELMRGGFLGVDVFFVISGYLITSIITKDLESSTFSLGNFYARRVRRLFPSLISVLFVVVILGWIILSPKNLHQLANHLLGAVTFTSNFFFWREANYFDHSSILKPLWHLWSLAVEEQFYIFWPWVLMFAARKKIQLKIMPMSFMLLSLFLSFFLYFSEADQAQLFYSPLTRIWEILAGSFVALINNKKQRYADVLSVFGFVYLFFSFTFISDNVPYPQAAILPVLASVILIIGGEEAWINRKIFSVKYIRGLGLLSYPLYLWHWPVISFATLIMNGELSIGFRVILILLSLVLAWITYAFVEKPLRFSAKPKILNCLIILSLGIGCMGLYLRLRSPTTSQLPAQLKDLMSQKDLKLMIPKYWREHNCYLNQEQDYDAFSNCPDSGNVTSTKSLLLWGDSHAAHLYPGILKKFGREFKIIQRTSAACPPLLGVGKENLKYCKKINEKIFESIKKQRPIKVILASRWFIHPWEFMTTTINELKRLGISDIVVIGPFPYWTIGLPEQLYGEFLQGQTRIIPKRLKKGLQPAVFKTDELMSAFVQEQKVKYVSATAIFCNKLGCLTRLGESWDSVVSFDHAHLTPKASEYFIEQIYD